MQVSIKIKKVAFPSTKMTCIVVRVLIVITMVIQCFILSKALLYVSYIRQDDVLWSTKNILMVTAIGIPICIYVRERKFPPAPSREAK